MLLKVSQKWASKLLTCNPAQCGQQCCSVFDHKAGHLGGPCGYLEPTGCTLPWNERPLSCLLYPFKINKAGTLVLHFRVVQGGRCRGGFGHGKPIMETMYFSLKHAFKTAVLNKLIAEIRAGRTAYFTLPDAVAQDALSRRTEVGTGKLFKEATFVTGVKI